MHLRVFFKAKVQNGEYFLGLLKFQIFLGCLKFLIFLGVNGSGPEPMYDEKMRVPPPHTHTPGTVA